MGIDLSIFLMSKGTSVEQTLIREKRDKEYVELALRAEADLPSGTACYLKQPKSKEPAWCTWLDRSFDFGATRPRAISNGCIVLLPVKKRVFVLAFGVGRHAIDASRIEFDFGLRVAMQKVHPEQLRQVVSKTVDVRTKEKSTYHHAGGRVGEFAMNLDTEWLRSISGKVEKRESFSAIAGADSVKLTNYAGNIPALVSVCGSLLAAFRKPVPEAFAFAEHVRPISQKDPRHKALESKFRERLNGLDFDGMEVIVDWATASQAKTYELSLGSDSVSLPDLTGMVFAR
jgi:uncharacterized protein (TIGR04141 family)